MSPRAPVGTEVARLRGLDAVALRARWRAVTGRPAPKQLSTALLLRLLAYRIQADAFGDLSRDSQRLLERIGQGQPVPLPQARESAGTVMVREWKGTRHHVMTLRDGFAWNGTTYRSLSEVAFAITGTKRSGPRFFGIKPTGPTQSLAVSRERPMTKRCAIYTRVSTEHGLEQEFNSLDNQREAAEAYIRSQAHEGWRPVRDRFDDGGFSGGSMERPALHRLLAEVRAGRIDIIVVYKVDRLTRSLADFAKLVELFDAHDVSFVSVTQAFNTTTSMGRLTLNVLLSFAQFEREVTGERIRDKIAASKRRGMWVGGNVPLGYRVEAKKLVVVEAEAEQVRLIYRRYLEELGSLGRLLVDLRERGMVTKALVRNGVVVRGAIPFTRGPLAYLLRNRFYVGEIAFKGAVHAAEHPAMLERELFDAVQARLTEQRRGRRGCRGRSGALLLGKLHDDAGHRMTPSNVRKGHRSYRYYISRALIDGRPAEAGTVQRVSAPEVEGLVLDALRRRFLSDAPDGELIAGAVERIDLEPDAIRVTLRGGSSEDHPDADRAAALVIPWQRVGSRRHRELIRVPDRDAPARPMRVETRGTLITAIARGRRWLEEIVSGAMASPEAIAVREGCSHRQVNATISLASLAPDIVEAAIAGRLPHGIALRDLTDLPLAWSQQRERVGFGR